jgi:DNA-binding response OmpR family regulator
MVDDAPDVGAFVQRVAEAVGYDMQFADRAEGFKTLYRSFHPDVVILDLAIPGTDGVELLIFLAEEDSSAQVLLMSGFGAEIRDSALRFGAARGLRMAGIVPKPMRVDELRSILEYLQRQAEK